MDQKDRIITVFLSRGGIGEVILQTPFYRALRRSKPEVEIHAFLNASNATVLHRNPYINAIHTFLNTSDMIARLQSLHADSFDTCFIFDKSWKSNYLSRLLITSACYNGFRRRMWEALPLGSKVLYTAERHESRYYLDLLKNDCTDDLKPEIFPSIEDRAIVDSTSSEFSHPLCCILAGGANNPAVGDEPFRRWPIENYRALANRLLANGYSILLAGGTADAELNRTIIMQAPEAQRGKIYDVTGRLSLHQSALMIGKSDLVICHDSGLMHLASCYARKLICLFGPTSPVSLLPKVPGTRCIWKDADIYSPRLRVYGTRKINVKQKDLFYKRISVEDVWKEISCICS
jgi:ADP-heptose:LPS heptosyltransferase